jgi:ribosomal peptide maturation radical SAM protein 1
MAFRSKSAERVLDELAVLSRRHRSYRFTAVDNILDMKFHKTLFPAIAANGLTYSLFYEVKSGVSPDRLKELRAAGVVRIQPGIESLSTRVLGLMNKGVKAIANVNLLRWSARLDIDVHWNLIWGFPGEVEDDYLTQLELLPRLAHLQPPIGAGRIWLERFSPLFQSRAASGPPLTPERSLRHVYPPSIDLQRAAYFFEYDFKGEAPERVYQQIHAEVSAWHAAQARPEKPRLEYRYSEGFLQIDDTRATETSGIYTFEDDVARLYLAMADTPQPLKQLRERSRLDNGRFDLVLEQFCANGLAMRDGEHVLALAIPYRAVGRPS